MQAGFVVVVTPKTKPQPRAQAWQSPEAPQQLSTAHMAYCCAALVQLIQGMTKADLDASPQLLSALVSGVSTHLDSPLPALKWVSAHPAVLI